MNRLSIKLRVTLWYTLLMLIIVLLVLGFMLMISWSVVENNAKTRLMTVIDYNAEEVEYDDGELEIDDDDFDFYKEGVYAMVYSARLQLISGQLPKGFTEDVAFSDRDARIVETGGTRYYVYDRLLTFKKHGAVWVRGVISLNTEESVIHSIIRIAFIALPILVLIAAAGGYFVTKRAFRPVRNINHAADAITEGKDLSKRIDAGGGRDEIHELATTINRMLERLEKAFEAEKQFVSDASHELRTPVSVILAQCEMTLEREQPVSEYIDTLRIVERQAGNMARLIAHLLTVTRLEQGASKANFEMVDLSRLLTALCEEETLIAPRGISLHTLIAPGIQARVDAALVTMLFHNLVSNAFKYGKDNGQVTIDLHAEHDTVVLRVSDNGPGIPKSEQEKIWRRFYQADPSRTPDGSGSVGLGLSIVRQIAYLHGGRMTLDSALGKGSTFEFRFPQK